MASVAASQKLRNSHFTMSNPALKGTQLTKLEGVIGAIEKQRFGSTASDASQLENMER